MEEAGVKILFSSSDMAVVGLTEVLSKVRTVFRASRSLKSILKTRHPDLLILLDYPDFNLHIARIANRFRVPVLYYISPQVWAWRRGRVKKIARRVDRMAVILPFEKAFYGREGVNVDYVGHPLLDVMPSALDGDRVRGQWGISQGDVVLGLVPGSRREEVGNLLPAMVNCADILAQQLPGLRCLLPQAPTIDSGFLHPFLQDCSVDIQVVRGRMHEVLAASDVALVTSGTATLEAAIVGAPMVITYRMSPFSYWVAKRVVKVSHIGLVNLVAGEEIVPELIQGEVEPRRLAQEALRLLQDGDTRRKMVEKLAKIRGVLGRGGASRKTARIALEMMQGCRS